MFIMNRVCVSTHRSVTLFPVSVNTRLTEILILSLFFQTTQPSFPFRPVLEEHPEGRVGNGGWTPLVTHMILHLRKYKRVRVPLAQHRSSLGTSPGTVVSRNHKRYSAVQRPACTHQTTGGHTDTLCECVCTDTRREV